MTFEELQSKRDQRWHADGNAVRTFEAAREFVDDVGLCLMYPNVHSAPAPVFTKAWLGRGDLQLNARSAFSNSEAAEAESMTLRLLRERAVYEWPFGESVLLVSASVFSFFYALASDREGRQHPAWGAGQKLPKLARDAWMEFQRTRQPLSEEALRQQLGKGVTESALSRTLHELWQRLRIMRVDRSSKGGDIWDSLSRLAAKQIKESEQLSVASALSALISKYVDAVIAAKQSDIETFFSPLVSRTKVRDALNALLAAREITTAQIGSHTMLQITPPKTPAPSRIAKPGSAQQNHARRGSKERNQHPEPRRSGA